MAETDVCRLLKNNVSTMYKFSKGNETCKELIRSSRIVPSLVSLLLSSNLPKRSLSGGFCSPDQIDNDIDISLFLEESLAALVMLTEDEPAIHLLATPAMLSVLSRFLLTGSEEAKEQAALILERLSLIESFRETMGGSPQVMGAIAYLLCDNEQPKLIKAATKTLLALCLLRENRRRAVKAGLVAALIEVLPLTRSTTAEKVLATLELLSTVEEGKAAVMRHALAVPLLVNMILRVSGRGTEYAAGTLSSICSESKGMQEAAILAGAPTKLLLLIQSDCTSRAKRKASQLLKVLYNLLQEDPCCPELRIAEAIHY